MTRMDTKIEAEGAEFLVLGNLLIQGVTAYKAYTNMKGYDLIAINPNNQKSARVQVKSRWGTTANSFVIKNYDCEFVVLVLLNSGSKDGKLKAEDPAFYIFPVELIQTLPKKKGWGSIAFKEIPEMDKYKDNWGIITHFLSESKSLRRKL